MQIILSKGCYKDSTSWCPAEAFMKWSLVWSQISDTRHQFIIFSINNIKGPSRLDSANLTPISIRPYLGIPAQEVLRRTRSGLAKSGERASPPSSQGPLPCSVASESHPSSSLLGGLGRVAPLLLLIALTFVTPDMPGCTSVSQSGSMSWFS